MHEAQEQIVPHYAGQGKDRPYSEVEHTANILASYPKRNLPFITAVMQESVGTKIENDDIWVTVPLKEINKNFQIIRRATVLDATIAGGIFAIIAIVTCLAIVYGR